MKSVKPSSGVRTTTPSPMKQPPGASARSRYASVSMRCFGVALLLLLILVTGRGLMPIGISAALGGSVLLVALDRRNPLCLRNFFIVYSVALFALGIPLFDLVDRSLYADMLIYIVAFLIGYALSAGMRPIRPSRQYDVATRTAGSIGRVHRAEETIRVLAFVTVLSLALKIATYGVGSFYGGQALVDQFATYGAASVSGGVTQIVNFFLRYTSIAAVVIYVQASLSAAVGIRYRYPLVLLVGLPILSLARSDALIGAGFVLVIYGVERRIAARPSGSNSHQVTPTVAPVGRKRTRRSLAMATIMVTALLAALVIGGLRQSRMSPAANVSALERSVPLLQSEFTPIQAYAEIKENQEILGRPYGSTIVWPLVFKVVPRGLFPGKPNNSGAYYMSKVRPLEFAAGYALPPTFFGDIFLNFGTVGAILGCLLLGFVAARLDVAYKEPQLSRIAWFLIVYANFYSLLRSPLSESLAGLLLTTLAWFALRQLVLGGALRRATPAVSGPLVRTATTSQGGRRPLPMWGSQGNDC